MGRTKPVHWCRRGGVDTFRKAPAQRETYDAIRDELKAARAGHRLEGIQARRSGRKAMLQLERERLRVIHGGAISVGRKALDLVKQQKMAGHAAESNDPHAPPPLKGSASAPSV